MTRLAIFLFNRYNHPAIIYSFLTALLLAVSIAIAFGDGSGLKYAGAAGK